MAEKVCPGLPADWLNSWLAAVGITVLDSRIKLGWTDGPSPAAVLSVEGNMDPIDALVVAWPDKDRLDDMPLKANWRNFERSMERKIPVEIFQNRISNSEARSHPDSWTLSSTVTDLFVDRDGNLGHGPLDPPGPGTIKWLHHRLVKTHGYIKISNERVSATLGGYGERVADNGLGFDLTRITSQADESRKMVDPIIEVLAFFGLFLFPVRGDGVDLRIPGSPSFASSRQRGWERRPRVFRWPAWRQLLTLNGIDALLDVWSPDEPSKWKELGVHAGWRTVEYMSRSSSDPTTGFGTQRL